MEKRLAIALGLTALLCLPEASFGIIRRDGDGGPAVICPEEVEIAASLTSGLPVLGGDIEIAATPGTVVEYRTRDRECQVDVHALPRFSWQLVARPNGSSAALSGTSTLTPTVKPDLPGTYRVRFTGCPGGCTISAGGRTLSVPAATREIAITAADKVAIPPETEPYIPPQTPASSLEVSSTGCSITADSFAPAYMAVGSWNGVGDYRTLSGTVKTSKVSRKDNVLNHDTQDHNAIVKPDPASLGLLPGNQDDMEVEWEWAQYRDRFWPTRGDRLTARGYWIFDCAHEAKTEIHPPVMAVAQRPRAVQIPASRGFGTNIWVPGVVADVWIRNDAGEVTGNCSLTGLHKAPFLGTLLHFLTCLPGSAGFGENPIQQVYTFDLHLPRDPREVIAPVKDVPPFLIYAEAPNIEGSSGPLPKIERHPTESNVLRVTIDLTGFTLDQYSRRIVAGWILPSPDNWGLRRWKLRFTSLDVHDDGDGVLRGDGDWRFWINANNADREWQQVFNCNGCVHGHEDFDGRPWETDSPLPDRRFGADLRLFPGQKIFIHSGGYEDDWMYTDSTGSVDRVLSQEAKSYSFPSRCSRSGMSGCSSYTLNLEVLGGDPELPELTEEGQKIYDGYVVTLDDLSTDTQPLPPLVASWDLPTEVQVMAGNPPATFPLTRFFPDQGIEPNSLADIEDSAFQEQVAQLQEAGEGAFDAWMEDLRAEADQAFTTLERDDVLASLAVLQEVLPADAWTKYFGDLKLPALP